MSARPPLPWDQLFELHVVKKVAKLLARRWNLGLGWADTSTAQAQAPRTTAHARGRSFCQMLQCSAAGARACGDTASGTLGRFVDEAGRGVIRRRALTLTCHAGITEVAAPVLVGPELVGVLLCGGFVPDDESSEAAFADIRESAQSLGMAGAEIDRSQEEHPCLSRREVSFVGELIEEAATEIADYLRQVWRSIGAEGSGAAPTRPLRDHYDAIIGAAEPMQQMYSLLDKVVASDSTVLITGENGTGKELVARAIHVNSARKKNRFVVQNCSAFNDNLLDSELFGHKRGSFTGAIADKKGLFEVADNGTFFLDEIGDMSQALQVKVLRVLQEGTFTPVGDTEVKHVDVRIIAATNRDLQKMVERGQFREDLYYRINVINLELPPLRERVDDIELLLRHFLAKHSSGRDRRIAPGCLERLTGYQWPGNVRELENEVERLVVLADDSSLIDESLLSPRIRTGATVPAATQSTDTRSLPDAVRALERRMIVAALDRNDWNKTRAAAELQISRRNLIRLVQKYELDRSSAIG